MAESWMPQRRFNDSFSNASRDAEERVCDPCRSEDKWLAVEGYCQICKEYLCGNCLGVHRKQRITKGHVIIDKLQLNQTPKRQGPMHSSQCPCVEVCKTHHPEIVRFYCKAHDEPGCGDCMTLKHTSCKKDRVQDVSEGFQATKEFKQTLQDVKKFHTVLVDMEATLDDNSKNMDTSYNTIQHKITSFRKQVNDYLDQTQEQVTQEASELRKQHKTEMKKLIDEIKSMKSELEDVLQRTQDDSDLDENSIFVITKQANQRLRTMAEEIHRIEQSLLQLHHYEFRPSTEIENILLFKPPLGELLRKSSTNTTTSYRNNSLAMLGLISLSMVCQLCIEED